MNRRRPLKITKSFALDPQDEATIKKVADEQQARSDSEALRFIISQYRLFLSERISSVQDFQQSNQAA